VSQISLLLLNYLWCLLPKVLVCNSFSLSPWFFELIGLSNVCYVDAIGHPFGVPLLLSSLWAVLTLVFPFFLLLIK
jgi:hypothetical protein